MKVHLAPKATLERFKALKVRRAQASVAYMKAKIELAAAIEQDG
jgi:hypothetical protein